MQNGGIEQHKSRLEHFSGRVKAIGAEVWALAAAAATTTTVILGREIELLVNVAATGKIGNSVGGKETNAQHLVLGVY